MMPLLREGQEILATRSGGNPRAGEVWILSHPNRPNLKIVKLVDSERGDGHYWVLGLNESRSEDSREFGLVRRIQFLGRVTSLFS
jgi:Signal peptidase, peptidase S26